MTNEQIVTMAVQYMQEQSRAGQEMADKALVAAISAASKDENGDVNQEVYTTLLSKVTGEIEKLIEAEAEAVGNVAHEEVAEVVAHGPDSE